MKIIKSLALLLIISTGVYAQNIAITDDNGYTADPSAMLDVNSIDKGMLVPRVTSAQRAAISSPAAGLLVFDSTVGSFYFYTGTGWMSLSNSGEIWTKSGNDVFTTDINDKVGVGTNAPVGKLEVKADGSINPDEPIFEVLNANGDTVFAVYPEGVRINVDDNIAKATGNRGGFAVGGFSSAKGYTNEFLRVTPDSVRIYIDDEFVASKATGNRGGFAVGGFSGAKGLTNNYLFVQDDSTRVYIGDSTSGFGVASIQGGGEDNLIDLTTENYFIGHESGLNSLPAAVYNSFFGYQSGKANTTGKWNVFLGYRTGASNTTGHSNIFIGEQAGASNTTGPSGVFIGKSAGTKHTTGYQNIFIGEQCGYETTTGHSNLFMGRITGYSNTTGNSNVYLGKYAGYANVVGSENTFIGTDAGMYNEGSGNITIGFQSGYNLAGSNKLIIENSNADTANALLYGEFDNDFLSLNATVSIRDVFTLNNSLKTVDDFGTLPADKSYIQISGNGAPVGLSDSAPVYNGSFTGQLLIIEGVDNVNTVSINDSGNVNLSAPCTLGLNDTLMLVWNGSVWVETNRSDN